VMDSRKPTHGDEEERGTENVVRLPRDWLGPRDELVPIGPRAGAVDTSDGDQTEAFLPNASSFWDEDSGSLQAPMQAPAGAWQPTPAARPASPRPRRRRLPRPRFGSSASRAFISRRRATAAMGVLATGLLLILAVIGRTEGGTHKASNTAASISKKKTPIEPGTGVNRARPKAKTHVVTHTTHRPKSHNAARTRNRAARSHAHKHRIHVTTVRQRHHTQPAPQPTHSTGEPVRTPTTTYTPTATSPTTSGSSSTSSVPPQQRATVRQPAFGSNGSLGPGKSSDS
jgi:hypothetical protein